MKLPIRLRTWHSGTVEDADGAMVATAATPELAAALVRAVNAVRNPSSNVYRDALDSQAACNLGALVHGFDRVITALQIEQRTNQQGSRWLNHHPAVLLFVEQLHFLAGEGNTTAYHAAYAECETRAKEQTAATA